MNLGYGGGRRCDVVPQAPALEVCALGVSYPGSRDKALDGVSLCVEAGKNVALIGANGSGKSTLLKSIVGLLPSQEGYVRVYGGPVNKCHQRVAYLPQRGEVDWRFPISLRHLVMTGRYVHLGWLKRPNRGDREIVNEIIAQLGLANLADRQIGQLSGGQQQRTLLARTLVQEADVILLDEPLNALDADTRQVIMRVLEKLVLGKKTVVSATHDTENLATHFDASVRLVDGRRVQL